MKKLLSTAAMCLVLSACQSAAPPPLTVVPQANQGVQITQPLQLSINDNRSHNYLLRIEHGTDSAQFSPSNPLISEAVKGYLTKTLTLQDNASSSLHIDIDEAIVRVSQKTMSYQANHEIAIRTTLQYGNKTLRKTFSGKSQSEGAFKADPAVLEREFSDLLARILNDMLNDPQISLALN